MELFKLVGSVFINSKDANNRIDEINRKAQGLASQIGSAMKATGSKMTELGAKLAPVSAAVGAAFIASTKGASDFQDGMAKMSTLFDTSKTSIDDLSNKFLTLSNSTGVSATELAEAGYQALSAGQSVSNVSKFVETASNLARAGFTSTTTAVDVLTTAINAYGEKAGTADQISNKLVRTQNLGKTTVDELASSMGKIIPTASSMGVNIDNLSSGYVALTKQGIATAEATTYMNGMFNELGNSGTKLGGAIKEKTGKSFQECMSSGMSLADVLKITKQYADENGIAYNELWSSMEAGKAGLSILNGGVTEFNNTVGVMSSKTNDVSLALDKLNTPSLKAEQSLNRIKNTGIKLGESLLDSLSPVLDDICDVVEDVAKWFDSLDGDTKKLIMTIAGITTVVAPVLLIGGKLIQLFSLFANPVGIAVVAITGLIGVFTTLYKKNKGFRDFVQSAWAKIKSVISTTINIIKTVITTGFNIIKTVFSTVWNGIKLIVSGVWNGIKGAISGGLNIIKSIVTGGLNGVKSVFSNIWNGCKNIVSGAINKIKSFLGFKWSLPKLKLPHFTIKGKFSLTPPSIPTFGISWYKKAMDSPFMFTKPTLFDINPITGSAKGAGESGDEIMYGHGNLMNDIQNAVAHHDSLIVTALNDWFTQLFTIFEEWFPQFKGQLVLDTGVLVAEITPTIDAELGKIIKRKERR